MNALSLSHASPLLPERPVDQDFRGYPGSKRDVVTRILDSLAKRPSPAQIVELACVAGWRFYNTARDSLQILVEAALRPDTSYIKLV